MRQFPRYLVLTTRSKERFEAPSEFVLQVLEATPPETTLSSKWDTAGDVSRRNSRLYILQHVPYPLEVSALPDPEPTVSLRAWPSCPTCPLDTLLEDVISKRPARSCPSLPQTGLETAVEQSPEPRIIDSVAALVRARLAARSACDESACGFPNIHPTSCLGWINDILVMSLIRLIGRALITHLLPRQPSRCLKHYLPPCRRLLSYEVGWV